MRLILSTYHLLAHATSTLDSWAEQDATLTAIADELWKDSNSFEWQKASNAEFINNQKYPYMLCHTGTNEDGTFMSGYRRTEALKAAIDVAEGDELYLRPLYNEEDYLCVYGQLFASDAAGITGEGIIVQPLVPPLKFLRGSFDKMKSEIEYHSSDEEDLNPSLDMMLCPGVSLAGVNATADDTTEVGDWEEIPDETAQDIVDSLVPKTIASKLAVSLSDTYYLTSEAYGDAIVEDPGEATERSKEWKQLLEEYHESGKCDETYRTRLKWTIQRTSNPETDNSIMSVSYLLNTTGEMANDIGCFLTLSLAIAAHPNVCTLESRDRIRTYNLDAQYLTQSEIKDRRPLFDVGLDGSGQVVALSDSGIDRDNCYFGDSSGAPSVSLTSLVVGNRTRNNAYILCCRIR